MHYMYELYKIEYACRFNKTSIHLGFLLNTSKYYNLGFKHQDHDYVSVFTFEDENSFFVEEYSNKAKYSSNPKYIVFFKGNDDTSYGLRFKSREDRDDFIERHLLPEPTSAFTEFIRSKCLTYN